MATTTATDAEIAEARDEVRKLETIVANTRYELVYAIEDEHVDRLAAELTEARGHLRIARNVLGDMEAGAGDFHDWDADDGED
jgi:hypothetical protein